MTDENERSALEALVNEVLSSSKYRDVSPALISSVGAQELGKRRSLKEAVKATKNKLHQVGGAYLAERQDYSAWQREIVHCQNESELQRVCRQIMSHHASTRERLPILASFYETILAGLAPIRSVIDIACGLNPLAIPWMSLPEDVHYYAYDIYQQMMDFLAWYMRATHINGQAEVRDVLQACPTHSVDLAFVLKTIPCLEQIDKQAGHRLLRALNAKHLIVSFPVHSLGGRNKHMAANYEAHFRELVRPEPWTVHRYEFATELVFVVSK